MIYIKYNIKIKSFFIVFHVQFVLDILLTDTRIHTNRETDRQKVDKGTGMKTKLPLWSAQLRTDSVQQTA